MSVIVLLIIAGGTVAAGFLGAFVWAVRSGQFDDLCTPAIRILFDRDGLREQVEARLHDGNPAGPAPGTDDRQTPDDCTTSEVTMSVELGRYLR
jgi:cbb3-type cytochrome oxidase maturation protein